MRPRRLGPIVLVLVLLVTGPIGGPAEAKAVVGGPGDDALFGGRRSDSMNGAGGMDRLFGRGGADTLSDDGGVLFGGPKADTLSNALGAGTIFDDDGDAGDTLTGASTSGDLIFSADGAIDNIDCGEMAGAGEFDMAVVDAADIVTDCKDVITTSGEHFFIDFLFGTSAAETLDATAAEMQDGLLRFVMGLGGNDTLLGSSLSDYLLGGRGRDRLFGGSGDDTLIDDDGRDRDVLKGEDGNDTIYSADGGDDKVNCGAGTDIAYVDKTDVVKNCETVVKKTLIG